MTQAYSNTQLSLWVLKAQQGDKQTLELLYRAITPKLTSYACKLAGDQALGEDCCQNAWLKVIKHLPKISEPKAFRGLLYQAVRWQLTDIGRMQTVDSIDDVADEVAKAESTSNEQAIELLDLINQLPSVEREVIELFYLHELTIDEVSRVLALAKGTVKSRLFRARKSLSQQLEDIENG